MPNTPAVRKLQAEEIRVQVVEGGAGEEPNELRVVSCWLRPSVSCRPKDITPRSCCVDLVFDISGLLYSSMMS